MSNFDWLDLDAKLLRLLVTVVEAGSVTGAAQQLGVTQSAVSHLLDKLRLIVGDPLFVKSGRGIVATARAEVLATEAREVLRTLERFARLGDFDPAHWDATFTIAANDFQRDLLLPHLMTRLRQQAPKLSLRVIPSDIPSLEMLRHEHCQLAISPRPPNGADIVQKRLFESPYRVFYDASVRQAPSSQQAYLAAEHITVLYEPRRALDLDQWLEKHGFERKFRVMVPGFAGLPAFIRGSNLLATVPDLLQLTLMQGLDSVPMPIPCPTLPMYMIWHLRYQNDPAHRWLRRELDAVAQALPFAPDSHANPASSTYTCESL